MRCNEPNDTRNWHAVITPLLLAILLTRGGQRNLSNGENLDGWTPKFTGYPAGVNHLDTFTVEDGLLTVSYDNWTDFQGEFGHLFHERSFSHYLLHVEYRFVGDQVVNGPAWAFRNNGLMLHSQAPDSMTLRGIPASVKCSCWAATARTSGPRLISVRRERTFAWKDC